MAADHRPSVVDIRKRIAVNKIRDHIFWMVGLLSTLVGFVLLFTLMIDLFMDGFPRLGWSFFMSYPSRFADRAGILSAWVGTTLVMIVTAATAVPLGVAAGVYLEEYSKKNWLTDVIEINMNNLAGVPSIIYGLLALGLFVYFLKFGESVLTGGLTLGLLILPMVVIATREFHPRGFLCSRGDEVADRS
jgi:phosphate transport system permease protein